MQAALKEAQREPQECNVGEVLQRAVRSMQDTCHSMGVVLDLPVQLAASGKGLMPASQSTRDSTPGDTAALSSRILHKRSLQWADSKANGSSSTSGNAPALLPPPSRSALAQQRSPAMAGLRACVSSEVCLSAS